MGSHGTFPATFARAASFDVGCSASDVATTIEPIPRDTMPLRDTEPLWDAVPPWDDVTLRGTVPLW